jgi:uncharacterized RDD family membrane protein YckC
MGVFVLGPPPLPEIRKENQLVKEPAPFQEEQSVKNTHYELPNNWSLKKKVDQTPESREQSDIVFLEGVEQAWPRLLARLFDYYFIFPLSVIISGLIFTFYDFAQLGLMGSILEIVFIAITSVLFMIYYEAFFLSKKGTTLGKSIAGIKVVDHSGNLLDFRTALKRSHLAIRRGCCYFICFPYASLWAFGSQKKILAGGNQLSWDKHVDAKTLCKRLSTARMALLILGVLSLFCVNLVLETAAKIERKKERRESLREELRKTGKNR